MRGDKTYERKVVQYFAAMRRATQLRDEINEMVRRAAQVTEQQFDGVYLNREAAEYRGLVGEGTLEQAAGDLRSEVDDMLADESAGAA